MPIRQPSRRRFLGASAALFSAIPILRPSYGYAQDTPTRLLVFTLPNGVRQSDWFSGNIDNLGPFLEVLSPYKSQINVFRGFTSKAALLSDAPDHQPDYSSLLTGTPPTKISDSRWAARTPSIDQTVAQWVMSQPNSPNVASLHFGARSQKTAFFADGGADVRPENDPYRMFDRHFAALELSSAERDRIRLRRQSVLDLVKGQFDSARCRYGSEEKQLLDAHLDRIRGLETRLQDMSINAATCAPPSLPGGLDASSNADMLEVGKVQQEMLALSLACGITRVTTMQHAGGQTPAVWEGDTHEWHGTVHDNAAAPSVREAVDHAHMRWPAKQFRALLDSLAAIPESGGTLLDHTLVVWVHEQGRTNTHDRHDHCIVTAGGANGQHKTGQTFDFGGRKGSGSPEGPPINKLLVSIAQMMGMGIDQFGDSRIPAGPLEQIHT